VPAPLGALRRLLAAHHRDISMNLAAERLGTSRRTLQRQLHEAHTTFPRELARARVAAAQELLLSSAANLTEAAYSAGFASTQQFSRTFRVLTGQTPRAWLAHSRAR
jgi:AraC-like DNA-binding protein